MNGTFQGLSIVLPHPCCKHVQLQRVIYDPRGGNRRWTVQEQAIVLFLSLKIPPTNKRENRVNTLSSKCPVNCRYAVGTAKIKLISFYLFQLEKMQWIGMASTQRKWLSPVWLSKCCRIASHLPKPKEVSRHDYSIMVSRNLVSFMEFGCDTQLKRQFISHKVRF